jgi:DNA-directed RNA polymerase specialized sigma24 family protein
MHRPSGPDLAQLLQDGTWLRGFVRTLVPAQDVDDVVQTTALAALQQQGPSGHPRAWLRGISANLARMTHRKRRRHERAMANVDRATEEVPAADPVADIAARFGLQEANVRQRLHHGREMVQALPSWCPPRPPTQPVRQPCARLSTSANWSSH